MLKNIIRGLLRNSDGVGLGQNSRLQQQRPDQNGRTFGRIFDLEGFCPEGMCSMSM